MGSPHLLDDERPPNEKAERSSWGRLPPPWVYMPGERTEEEKQRELDEMAGALRRPPPMQYLPGEERQEAVLARLVASVTGVEMKVAEEERGDDEEGGEPRLQAAPYSGIPGLGQPRGWWEDGPAWTKEVLDGGDPAAAARVEAFQRDLPGGGATGRFERGETGHQVQLPGVVDLGVLSPTIEHAGPASKFGEALDPSEDTQSGRVIDIAGSATSLWAVVTDRALWRWDRNLQTGWERVRGGPDGTRWIATVPEDPKRLLVGTENGLSAVGSDAGLWETVDEGETWRYAFNPLLWKGQGEPDNQTVTSLVVAPGGVAYFVTGYGLGRYQFPVGRKGPGRQGDPGLPSGPLVERVLDKRGLLEVAENGLPGAAHRLWLLGVEKGRLRLYLSRDQGGRWEGPWDLPPNGVGVPNWNPGSMSRRIAAVGNEVACMGYWQFPPRQDGRPLAPDQSAAVGYFDGVSWRYEEPGSFLRTGSGARGLHAFRFRRRRADTGRRPFTDVPVEPVLSPPAANHLIRPPPDDDGDGAEGEFIETWLWCCTAQNWAAKCLVTEMSKSGNGTEVLEESPWVVYTGSPRYGGPGQLLDHHVDLWEVQMDPDRTVFVTSDGGVARYAPGEDRFYQWSQGLTAHLISGMGLGPVDPQTGKESIAYGAYDNGGWSSRDGGATWAIHEFGDAGHCLADEGCAQTVILGHLQLGKLATYGTRQSQVKATFDVATSFSSDARLMIHALQWPETPPNVVDHLDIVRLVEDGGRLRFGQTDPGARMGLKNAVPALIRANHFKNYNNIPDWKLYWQKWMGGDLAWQKTPGNVSLPPDVVAFWPSGGRVDDPTYYLLDKRGAIWRRAPTANPPDAAFKKIMGDGTFLPPQKARPGRPSNEALFLDPYRPGRLFLFGATRIAYSEDHGDTLISDPVLGSLVTESGHLAYKDWWTGRSTASQIGARNNLSCMAFSRDREEVAAGSLFGGVFVRDAQKQWRDLSWLLPSPMVMVAGMAISGNDLFLATHGYGLWRIRGFTAAPLATWFAPRGEKDDPNHAATLYDATGQALAGEKVLVRARRGNEVYTRTRAGLKDVVTTDGAGRVSLPLELVRGDYLVHLQYGGDGPLDPLRLGRRAPCRTTIRVLR